MDSRFDRIDQRLDDYNAILVRLTVTVEQHAKRSDELEKQTELLREELKPVKKHVDLVNAGAKIISALVAGALAAKSLGLF